MSRLRETPIGRTVGRLAARLARLHKCQGGQAIYVVVVFFFLLAALLFLILNTGEKLNHKVEMQGAADSVALTGAAWYARGLNVVSMANVTETQLLSLIVLLDTLETVVPPATECIDDLIKHLGKSKAGRDMPIDTRLADPRCVKIDQNFVKHEGDNMLLVVGNAASEQQVIQQFDDIVKAVNWPEYLNYQGGVLWECTALIDGFSHAVAKDAPLAAAREAIDVATKNHADFGFCLPLWPALPVQDGQFMDFKNPMTEGRMPAPNERQIIGMFAYVMNYRGYHNQVMGPWSYWREPFTSTRPMGLFDLSRFSVLFNVVSLVKTDMLFGGTEDRVSLRSWEMDYDNAKGLYPAEVRRSWWESVSFDARYPQPNDSADPWQPEDPGLAAEKPFPPPSSGAWPIKAMWGDPDPRTTYYGDRLNLINFTSQELTRFGVYYRGGGFGPSLAGYTRATEAWEGADPREAVWYRVDARKTAQYPELGIFAPHPPVHEDGSDWPYTDDEKKTYYRVSLVRFDGAERDADETLHRRYLPPAGSTPNLAPILFDSSEGTLTTANINNHFTFDGFAYRSGKVQNWAQRFVNPNPIENLVCYAQARVYNRWSWDLFTQHWKAKLMRTDRWKALLPGLDGAIPSEGSAVAAVLTAERKKPVRDLLNAYSDDFVKEVSH